MRNNKLIEVSKKLYELFIKHNDNRDLAIGEFIGWLDNDSNLVENRVSQPSEPSFGQWIDVEDEYPKTGTNVLAYDESEEEPIYIAWLMSPRFEDDNTQIDEGSWQCEHYDKKLRITKWMPLPKP